MSRWNPVQIETQPGSPTRQSAARQISIERYAEKAIQNVLSGLPIRPGIIKY